MSTINFEKDFTRFPGGRYITDGPKSGEGFRMGVLTPAFFSLADGEELTVDLRGDVLGYPASFLEEAFGGFRRTYGIEAARSVKFLADDPTDIERIQAFIEADN